MSQSAPTIEYASEFPPSEKTVFGHPVGLYVLSFTEMWERFSFYTMRGVLTLYTAAVVVASLGKEKAGPQADAIYGAYLGFVYASTFIGGTLADRLLGQRRAIYIGGTLMAIAQFTLAGHALLVHGAARAADYNWLFFLALGLLSAGNGFFKPNISTIVGTLYKQGDGRRDVAFTIFYMGINIGAFLASISAGLGQQYGWHLGFIMAGTGMIVGMIIFSFGLKTIEGRGLPPAGATLMSAGKFGIPNAFALIVGVVLFVPIAGKLMSYPHMVQDAAKYIGIPVALYLVWEMTRVSREEAGRMVVILILCTFNCAFWGFFDMAGSTVTRFTDVAVNRAVMGHDMPASFLANVINPLVIIILSIPVAGMWVWLDRRRLDPPSPIKFVLGIAQLSLSFVVLYIGAKAAEAGSKCSIMYLILAFVLQSTGELCVSPVGLSMITKLAPARLVGMFMGVWFLSISLGDVLGPLVAGVKPGASYASVFMQITVITAVAAGILLVLAVPMKKLMHGVK